MPTWPIAVLSFICSFAVAEVTGVRPLGGMVLFAGAVWCARRWRGSIGTGRTAALLGAALVLFVVSHLLGDLFGTWGAVALISATVGALAWGVADVPASRRAAAAPAPA